LAVSVARVIWRDRLAKIADTKILGIDTQWFIWYNLSSVTGVRKWCEIPCICHQTHSPVTFVTSLRLHATINRVRFVLWRIKINAGAMIHCRFVKK
jgi:hypothetical protein